LRALRSARRLVYLENQFLWSPEIVNILADKLRRPPADDFRVVMMLPGRPNTGEDDTRAQLALLAEADGDQGRFLATTIRARSGNTSDRVYVHAKVGIVDELWRPIAAEQRERRARGEPMTHGLLELKATSRRSERLLGPLQALLVDG
jgi:phosphatidylserine/phosphatidylglycerophosphate/cardiolipin synthase-like enzyme